MSNAIDWSTAPEGATHYNKIDCICPWLKDSPPSYFEDGKWVEYSSSYGKAHIATAVVRPWQGHQDGLPPIGTECLYHNGSTYAPGKIVAHADDGDGIDAIIQCDGAWYCGRSPDSFKPLQSERDKAIDDMNAIARAASEKIKNYTPHMTKLEMQRAVAGALYDAGYRKP